jgi:hypothetical protein
MRFDDNLCKSDPKLVLGTNYVMHVINVVIVANEVPPFTQVYDNMLNEVLVINKVGEIMPNEVHKLFKQMKACLEAQVNKFF